MRLFYLKYQKSETLSHQLSWSHYFELLKIEDDLFKLLYLVVIDSYEKRQTVRDWSQMVNQLGVYFGDRVTNQL